MMGEQESSVPYRSARRKLLLPVLGLLTVLLAVAAGTFISMRATPASGETSAALNEIAAFGNPVSSCTGRFRLEWAPVDMAGVSLEQQTVLEERVVEGSWVMDGARFREDTTTVYADTGRTERLSVAFDGSRTAILWEDGTLDHLQDVEMVADHAQFGLWLGVAHHYQPEARRLTHSIPLEGDQPTIGATETVAQTDCLRIDANQSAGGSWYTWWVAPQYGHMVMRVDSVSPVSPADPEHPQSLRHREEVLEVTDFGNGIFLPTVVERVASRLNPDGSVDKVYFHQTFTAADVTVNEPVDPGAFELESHTP